MGSTPDSMALKPMTSRVLASACSPTTTRPSSPVRWRLSRWHRLCTTSRDLGPRTFFASSARLELELASSARLELELASSARLELEAGDVQPTPEQSSRVGRLSVLSENFQRSVALSDAAVA